MNKKVIKYYFILTILCFINIPVVFSKEVVKTCKYEGDILFEIYDDDSKPHTTKTAFGEDILNWGSDDYEYDAKKDWEETKRCPLYVIDIGTVTTKYVFSDEEHKLGFSDNKNYIYTILSSNPSDKYIKGDPYACEYENFSIEFNSEGYAVDITYPDQLVGDQNYWTLDKSLTDNAYSPGLCPNVNYCYTISAKDEYNVEITYHTIASDSMALDNADVCAVKSHINNFLICEDGENCNGDNGVCGTYTDLLNDVKNKYNCSISDANCLYDSSSEKKLKSLCNSVVSNSNYNDSCLQKCLGLMDEISEIKNKDVDNNTMCGFSEKLILYIANIVKWVKYIIPVIVIVLGILDFIKAISADKDDEMKKAQGRFVKRLITAAIIFIVPFIIEFVLEKMGFDSNGCGIIDL